MRDQVRSARNKDPRITYRGDSSSRLDTLTDTVFGIAVTLLIFNLENPNSFEDLITFTKTLPAFLISIGFLVLVWNEHVNFSQIYAPSGPLFTFFHAIFLALVIFYVYPLRFISIYLTNFFFPSTAIDIQGTDVPNLLIYYGFVLFGLYFMLFIFYLRAGRLKDSLGLNPFEIFLTRAQTKRIVIMFGLPLISVAVAFALRDKSPFWASFLGGSLYFFYSPLMFLWVRSYKKGAEKFNAEGNPLPTSDQAHTDKHG